MSRGHRRKHSEEEEEHGPDERWMASYMDMVTVLMCMFIVLFAMSTVDAKKFDLLRNSLATGFGVTDIGKIDTAQGTVVQPDKSDKKSQSFAQGQLAVKEVEHLKALEAKISAGLAQQGLTSAVQYTLDARGLTIRLVDSQTFFAPNSTALTGVAPQVLDTISAVLAASEYSVSVEGHADVRQPAAPFATNWELSSGRAVQVLRRMVETGGVAAARIAAVGYGSSRPLAAGSGPEDLAQNRRVDIVAQSNASEAVRALIPAVLDGTIKDSSTLDASKSVGSNPGTAKPSNPYVTPSAQKVSPSLLPAGVASR